MLTDILIALLLTFINLGFLFLVVLGLPGTWLIALATALFAWWQWDPALARSDQFIGVPVLVTIVVMALAGEVIEFLAGAAGARRGGASGWGMIAAIVGTLVGGVLGTVVIPIPVVGSLAGACAGAAGGTWIVEVARGRSLDEAGRAGVGAGIGRFQGTMAKLVVGVAMWIVVAVAAFWP